MTPEQIAIGILVASLLFGVVYFAIRLGVRDGMHDWDQENKSK